jgi:hypothetical protein
MLASYPPVTNHLFFHQNINHEVAIVAILHARDTLSPAMFFQVRFVILRFNSAVLFLHFGVIALV